MNSRVLTFLFSATLLAGCNSAKEKPLTPPDRSPVAKPASPAKEESGDVAFQSFVSRLRAAVAAHDLPTLASMMAKDFGHRWDAAPQGESPFEYWDKNNFWPELQTVLSSRWTPHDGFILKRPDDITFRSL